MATQTIVTLIDDLTGGTADETITFAYDGTEYTIDLNAKNAAKLRKGLAPFVAAGVRITPARRRRNAADEETTAGRAMIREWATASGLYPDLAERGRIPRDVVAAYHRAHR